MFGQADGMFDWEGFYQYYKPNTDWDAFYLNKFGVVGGMAWDTFLASEDPAEQPENDSALFFFASYGIYKLDFEKFNGGCSFDWDGYYAYQVEWMTYYFDNERISSEDWMRFHLGDGDFDWDAYNNFNNDPPERSCMTW